MFTPFFPASLALFLILAVANLSTDLAFVRETRRVAALRHPPFSQYTFSEDDYPPHLPVPNARKSISLPLEESTHYGLTEPNTNIEWTSMSPGGDGNIRLGPNHRFFNTGFSYQLHCAKISFSRNFTAVRGGGEHMCRDSNALYQAMEQNWSDWVAFRKTLEA
ncbi:hypothetical protein LXA43DRAFT_1121095 [Ganoderma leucocontextum]|nr:hypothetical protein LXA43DRAFT_1121095 [Ganoderma leucocontextum]